MIINWIGPVGPTGYGRFSRFIVPELAKLGHNVNVIPSYQEEIRIAEPEIMQFYNNINENILRADATIRFSIANPDDAVRFYGKRRIFFNMLEVDKIPPFWVKALNTVDRVWVPSHWGKEVYKSSGVTRPIDVVPGGVDVGIFNPYRAPLFEKGDNYRFLFVGKWEYRKGIDIILKAFTEEFTKDEKTELVLMCDSIRMFNQNFNIYKELWNKRLPENRATIQIIEGIIPEYNKMGQVYTSCDAFINPTRGEGWNLPLIEAMACGLPCITTNWSAHTEFANEKNSYLINDYTLVKAIHPEQLSQLFLQFGRWAEPNVKEVKERMRYVFDNQEEAKKLGEKASKEMEEKWTWGKSAKIAEKALEKVMK